MVESGARYRVMAFCGSWRDGEVANSFSRTPSLLRELRKRFMDAFFSAPTPRTVLQRDRAAAPVPVVGSDLVCMDCHGLSDNTVSIFLKSSG